MKIICFIKGIFRSIINFNVISGHDYQEIYDNKDIQVLKCVNCDYQAQRLDKSLLKPHVALLPVPKDKYME